MQLTGITRKGREAKKRSLGDGWIRTNIRTVRPSQETLVHFSPGLSSTWLRVILRELNLCALPLSYASLFRNNGTYLIPNLCTKRVRVFTSMKMIQRSPWSQDRRKRWNTDRLKLQSVKPKSNDNLRSIRYELTVEILTIPLCNKPFFTTEPLPYHFSCHSQISIKSPRDH
jgi:hypothetical protein